MESNDKERITFYIKRCHGSIENNLKMTLTYNIRNLTQTLKPNLGCCLEISPTGIKKELVSKNGIKTKNGNRLPFNSNKIVFSYI